MKLFKMVLIICLAVCVKNADAQEMLGIMNSSYSGINGSVINPANPVTSPFYIDVNILAADLFAENNVVYLSKDEYRFRHFFGKSTDFPTHGPDNNLITYDYYNRKDKKAFAQLRLMGPSLAITVGKHSFGIVTGARTALSANHISYELAKFGYEQLNYPPQYDINYVDNRNMRNAELAWAENGINYSYNFMQRGLDSWSAGVTVKDLRGVGGGYLFLDNADYIMLDRDTLIVHNINAVAGYSLPLNYQSNSFELSPLFRGKGVGLDIGVIYEKKKNEISAGSFDKLCSQSYVPYQYKIGVSILDIGRIKFKNNAQKLVFDNASAYWPGLTQTGFSNVNNLAQTLSNEFYGDSTQLIQDDVISIALPTAISVQADYNYYKNWFVNGTLVYPIQFSRSGLIRPALIALTPRYQTSLFDISLPLTLYDLTKPRIGLSARFMGFYIGTEKLGGYFHFTDFTGIDFYFGLKFSLKKGFCRSKMEENCGIEEYKKFSRSSRDKKPRNKKLAP